MIGIQINPAGCALVAWVGTGLELIGEDAELLPLIQRARARSGADATRAIAAVPAWYNDEQRQQVRQELLETGIREVRLINEPTALVLAYSHTAAQPLRCPMVMTVSANGAFDVTIIRIEDGRCEVLAANGISQLTPELMADSDQLFSALRPVVARALADAGIDAKDIDAIIMGSASVVLEPVAPQIEATWGRRPAEPAQPESAIARGAAIFGRQQATARQNETRASPSPSKSGCLSLLVVATALTIALAVIPFFLR